MYVLILISLLAGEAQAACQLEAAAGGKTVKAPLTVKSSTPERTYYQAAAGDFIAIVNFDQQDKTLSAVVTSPTAGTFNFRITDADFIEELDCFGGGLGETRFKFGCNSRAWRDLKLKNNWGAWCAPDI